MKNRTLAPIIVGSIIILFGVLVLIDLVSRVVPIEAVLAWWPVVFILIGLLAVSSPQGASTGIVLLLAGTVAVADRLDVFDVSLRPIVISIVLLLAGLVLVAAATKPKAKQQHEREA